VKQILAALASALLVWTGPVRAQSVVVRDTRIGNSRVTEFLPLAPVSAPAQANAQLPAHYVAAQDDPAAKPVPNQPVPRIPAPKDDAASRPAARSWVDPQQDYRDAVVESMGELATAIRALNPSYAIAPVIGPSAMTAGSYYIRTSAMPVSTAYYVAPTAGTSYYLAPAGRTAYYLAPALASPPVVVPPPVVIGGYGYGYGYGYGGYPSWLYSGTLRVDVPPVAPVVAVKEPSAAELKDEIRRLRAQLDELTRRLPPEKK
jgi:hypothetical protein